MFSRKAILRTPHGTPFAKIRPCWTEVLSELTKMYAKRYAPAPLMITETAARGSMKKRLQWIQDSFEMIRQTRAAGVPLVGYTFWPLFSLFAWTYQRGGRDIVEYKLDMGLYDLVQSASGW